MVNEPKTKKNETVKSDFNLNDFMSSFSSVNVSFKKETDIYKPEIFEGEDKKSRIRGKIRKMLLGFMQSIIANPKNEKLRKEFELFYKTIYKVNDYSLQSVCSANMDEQKRNIIAKGLEILKK